MDQAGGNSPRARSIAIYKNAGLSTYDGNIWQLQKAAHILYIIYKYIFVINKLIINWSRFIEITFRGWYFTSGSFEPVRRTHLSQTLECCQMDEQPCRAALYRSAIRRSIKLCLSITIYADKASRIEIQLKIMKIAGGQQISNGNSCCCSCLAGSQSVNGRCVCD